MRASGTTRQVPRSRVLWAIVVALVAGFLVGFVVGGPVPGDEGSAAESAPPAVQFSGITEASDDRILFRFHPDTEAASEYRVTYDLREGPNTVESVVDRPTTLSAGDPLVIRVADRRPDTEYTLTIRITQQDRTVYDARLVVSRLPPTATAD